MTASRGACVRAGLVTGAGGLLLFGTVHWFTIAPVWAVFLDGTLFAGASGALVGWAYHETIVRGPLRHSRLRGSAFGAVFALALVPYELVGLWMGPFPEIVSPGDVVPVVWIAFIGLPFVVLGGWTLGRTRRAALVTGLAGLVLNFQLGGSMAFFGGQDAVFVLFLTFAGYYLVAGTLLPALVAAFGRKVPKAASAEVA